MPKESGGENIELEIEKPKRESGISRVIKATLEEEDIVLAVFKNIFEDQKGKVAKKEIPIIMEKYEREKTQAEAEVITQIFQYLPRFVEKYGGIPVPLSLEHIHMLDKKKVDEEIKEKAISKNEAGAHIWNQQFAYVYDLGSPLANAKTIVHEILHFNAFRSLEKDSRKKGINVNLRRSGFNIHINPIEPNKKGVVYFRDIDEAVIEELTIRFVRDYFNSIPALQEDLQKKKKFLKEYCPDDDFAEKESSYVQTEEVEEEGKKGRKDFLIGYSYRKERERLYERINDVYEANSEEFTTREEVFTIFAEAVMTGKLLKVARFVEKTYGKGSFRKLGEKTATE